MFLAHSVYSHPLVVLYAIRISKRFIISASLRINVRSH